MPAVRDLLGGGFIPLAKQKSRLKALPQKPCSLSAPSNYLALANAGRPGALHHFVLDLPAQTKQKGRFGSHE